MRPLECYFLTLVFSMFLCHIEYWTSHQFLEPTMNSWTKARSCSIKYFLQCYWIISLQHNEDNTKKMLSIQSNVLHSHSVSAVTTFHLEGLTSGLPDSFKHWGPAMDRWELRFRVQAGWVFEETVLPDGTAYSASSQAKGPRAQLRGLAQLKDMHLCKLQICHMLYITHGGGLETGEAE